MASKRTEKPKDVVEVTTDFGYLAEYQEEDTSTQALDEYRIVPRLKVVQGMSSTDLKEQFGEGAVIISPGNVPIADKREDFLFVPVFFFTEFCKWTDREDDETTAIEARSFDPTSDIAKFARDPERRTEGYGGEPKNPKDAKADGQKYEYRYVEHMNFAGVCYDEGIGEPVILSFSRGDFGIGRQFASSIKMRRVQGRPAPLWSCVFQFHSEPHRGPKGEWWRLRFDNAQIPFIAQEHAPGLKELHEVLKTDFEEQRLVVDHDGGEESETVDTSDTAEM